MAEIVAVISVPTSDGKFVLAVINSYNDAYVTVNNKTVDVNTLEEQTVAAVKFAWDTLRKSIKELKEFQNVYIPKQA